MSTSFFGKYTTIRSYTEQICKPLRIEDHVAQPVEFVSPPKWHLGHTSWFFETFILLPYYKGYKEYHPKYGFIFNSYYEAAGEKALRSNRGDLSRPTVEEIIEYRRYVDQHMLDFLSNKVEDKELNYLIELGLNHEQQHQELLLTDIKYILGHNPIFPAYSEEYDKENERYDGKGFILVKPAKYEIGHKSDNFCFDNELMPHEKLICEFEISTGLVTNGEYLEFIEDKGYDNFGFWHSEGWDWVKKNDIRSPLYWHKIEGEWFQYTLQGLNPLNKDLPVTHVSFFEASAYAGWKGERLPTEFEWEAAAEKLEWGLRWEHTGSAYLPYPGFRKADGAVGEYNGKFMINQMVLRGASIATPEGHSRISYRNFFHPDERWQFTGIRLSRNSA